MNCVICGSIIQNNNCIECGYYLYKEPLLNKLFLSKSKKNQNNELKRVNEFLIFFEQLKKLKVYISRSDYQPTLDLYQDLFQTISNLQNTNMLELFAKENKYDYRNLIRFLNLYTNLYREIEKLNESFLAEELEREKQYLDNILKKIDRNIMLDTEQRRAILTDEDYMMIIAGAGSGKTTTLAAKVKYLIEKKEINQDEILVISYTNKAVDELKDKINNLGYFPKITTFHKTGYEILNKENTITKIATNKFYKILNYLKNDILDDIETLKKLVLFFGVYLDVPHELLKFHSLEQYFVYLEKSDFSTLKSNLNDYSEVIINSKKRQNITIKSEFLKSNQEVQIANFLYLHNINYVYEKPYPHRMPASIRAYTPDFYIYQDGKEYYIEHFGISESGQNNRYNKNQLHQYIRSIQDKKKLHNEKNTKLICTYSSYNDGRDLITHLREELLKAGFRLERRKDEEVFNKILKLDKDKYFFKFARFAERFLINFKIMGYDENSFALFREKTNNPRTKLFLDIMERIYLNYQAELKRNGEIDFEDMINNSSKLIEESNGSNQILQYKYIIIDEYQDISRQRFDLTKNLANLTGAKVIVVGDDWQSIFAFAGSDITLFTSFLDKFNYGKELKITRTYRNSQELINIAGNFIQKNSKQIKKTLISNKNIKFPIEIHSYNNDQRDYKQRSRIIEEKATVINNIIGKILKENSKPNILLLGRYNFEGQQLSRSTQFTYNNNIIKSKKYPYANLTFLTAHAAKGLGFDYVIIINAENSIYGFPAQIEDDPIIKLVTKHDSSIEFSEERRLFYVALTRTKNKVYIVAPKINPSRFVLELLEDNSNIIVNGKLDLEIRDVHKDRKYCPHCNYPLQLRADKNYGRSIYVCMNDPEICDFITNNIKGGKTGIKACPKCDGYLLVTKKRESDTYFLGCSNYEHNKSCRYTEALKN